VIANPLVRKVVRTEYAMLRAPLAVVDRRVVARYLAEDSKVRISLERGLHTLDAVAGRLLAEKAGGPSTPASGRQEARTRPAGPAGTPPPADHPEPQEPDLEEEREQIVEHILEEQPAVGELADPDLDVAEVQAELRAKHLIQEREEERQLKEDGAV
jgi:hypothetical protein